MRIKKNKPITKTCLKHLWHNLGISQHNIESSKYGFVSYEFWEGKKFIGTILGEEDEKYIYIDTLLVNEKYRYDGNGTYIVNYMKSLYRYIAIESTDDAFGFWKKMKFRKKRNQNCIYTNTIDMHWKK